MGNVGFGRMTDHFGLQSQTLRLISSDNGVSRRIVRTSQTGPFNADHVGGAFANPVCTYMVVGDMTVDVTLGKAYTSGFFITELAIVTEIGKFPLVTVSATANEGADAINMWRVQVPVLARARAQNLLSSVSTSSELRSLRLVATCDPVVLWEGLAPSASDIVHGKMVVDATVISGGEVDGNPGSGWTSKGIPLIGGDREYNSKKIRVERRLV